MSAPRRKWLVPAAALVVLVVAGALTLRHFPLSWRLTTGTWQASASGLMYSLKFERDGTVVVRTPDSRYQGTYTLSTRGVTVHISDGILPWGQVRSLQLSSDGTALISTSPMGIIRYEHR